VRWIAPLAILTLAACACGGGSSPLTPEGPTTVTLEKTMVETPEGELRFTLTVSNEGDNAALNLDVSDVWQDQGLQLTAIGSVAGKQPDEIGDFGFEFILDELAAGESAEVVYTARCRLAGEWENTAAASAANAEPADASVTVACP
jgi:uncharacterized repeat protein (TIGR01451 family)